MAAGLGPRRQPHWRSRSGWKAPRAPSPFHGVRTVISRKAGTAAAAVSRKKCSHPASFTNSPDEAANTLLLIAYTPENTAYWVAE